MILAYVDETGNRDPRLTIPRHDGSEIPGDWLYVLTAVTLFDARWHGFEKTLNRHKSALMAAINARAGQRLDLADCEIKSNWLRIPRERKKHRFLKHLNAGEIQRLVDLFYEQLTYHRMRVFSILVDKRHLPEYMDQEKIHRKSWELLLERIELFMRAHNPKHQAMMITDDVGPQVNRSLAMKHAYLMDEGTKREVWLKHLCEMPMFVRSELSNGVQLADLCSYNIYRAFKASDLSYPFFERLRRAVWTRSDEVRAGDPFSGLWVFPGESPLRTLVEECETKRASEKASEARQMMSSGANPIQPTSGTGQTLNADSLGASQSDPTRPSSPN